MFAATPSPAAQPSPKRQPLEAITNAKWADYKSMYEKSPYCSTSEVTLWTCTVGKKTYSLCSTTQVTRKSGYIQYRATNDGRNEFVFPPGKVPPAGFFKYSTSANGDASIEFSNGGYQYSLIDPLRGNSTIEVSNQKRRSMINCEQGNQLLQLNYTMRLMYDSGVWEEYVP
jgi:hypothetical protein